MIHCVMNEWPNRVNKSVSEMNSMGFQTIGLLKFELKLQGKKQFTGRYCREHAEKQICVCKQ